MDLENNVEPELRIVLLGNVGVGKSASGNTILGRGTLFPIHNSLSPLTVCCKVESTNIGDQHVVVVVDTPGFDGDKELAMEEIKKSISHAEPGPHVFLIVLDIKTYTDEEVQMVEIILRTFGEDIMAHTMVLFTHGGKLQTTSIEDYIKSSENLRKLTKQCKLGYHVFKNVANQDTVPPKSGNQETAPLIPAVPDVEPQVTELLQKINKGLWKAGRKVYTLTMLREAEMAAFAKTVPNAGLEAKKKYLQTPAYSGIALGALIGYIWATGTVTATIGAVVGGVVGGLLSLAVAFLVRFARNRCTNK